MISKKLIITISILLLVLLAILIFSMLNTQKEQQNDLRKLAIATFAGGCFWCTEADFEKLPGVAEVISGYTGGELANPAYEDVSAGETGHLEAIQVYYDNDKVSYRELVQYLFKHIDPTDAGGSFNDRGQQYTSAIFYANQEEQKIAAEEKEKLSQSGVFDKEIATAIRPLDKFYPAEDYHQDYHKENPLRYKFYRGGSGRDKFLEQTWDNEKQNVEQYLNKTSSYDLSKLTPLQYKVTQEEGTEPPFKNEYWDEKRDGIYVDIVSGQPLFSSLDKYDSGTGWPSFTKPLSDDVVIKRVDRKLIFPRTEVKSSEAKSHLGHIFKDGPEPTGLRYCLNSAALRFVPKEDLEKEGLGKYLELFE